MCVRLPVLIFSLLAYSFTPKEYARIHLVNGYTQDLSKGQADRSRNIFVEGARDSLLWLNFLSKNSYRLASPDDFSVTGSLSERENPDLFRFVNLPCVAGDFNKDGAGDRACIIISAKQKNGDKFGLIVINGSISEITGEEVKTIIPSIHWIVKDRDLAKANLVYTLRSGLLLSLMTSGAKRSVYGINWSKKRNSYIYKTIL
jgi:hypothetical protein